ncbi:hypothetical protein CANCADRAFT_56769 [Tortispora caseinolytica NRRL Y-17796]|uniref:Uncharacterized protein n=1 Tax=Tortispora caseinolytica NRRL Y-17796 TaxID=767744 RepID=A0A1E4TEP6_9ASCO|nr:hypothetical protein CANCADRAFT_56769 [Tortispora caseinolytica NRRL Y-17796]
MHAPFAILLACVSAAATQLHNSHSSNRTLLSSSTVPVLHPPAAALATAASTTLYASASLSQSLSSVVRTTHTNAPSITTITVLHHSTNTNPIVSSSKYHAKLNNVPWGWWWHRNSLPASTMGSIASATKSVIDSAKS